MQSEYELRRHGPCLGPGASEGRADSCHAAWLAALLSSFKMIRLQDLKQAQPAVLRTHPASDNRSSYQPLSCTSQQMECTHSRPFLTRRWHAGPVTCFRCLAPRCSVSHTPCPGPAGTAARCLAGAHCPSQVFTVGTPYRGHRPPLGSGSQACPRYDSRGS